MQITVYKMRLNRRELIGLDGFVNSPPYCWIIDHRGIDDLELTSLAAFLEARPQIRGKVTLEEYDRNCIAAATELAARLGHELVFEEEFRDKQTFDPTFLEEHDERCWIVRGNNIDGVLMYEKRI